MIRLPHGSENYFRNFRASPQSNSVIINVWYYHVCEAYQSHVCMFHGGNMLEKRNIDTKIKWPRNLWPEYLLETEDPLAAVFDFSF